MTETWSHMLHLLVFVYWLGGDLGSFAASFTLTDSRQPSDARLAAAKLMNQIDMAPRSALILTFPAGLSLAIDRGWIAMPLEGLVCIWLASLLWLSALWWNHSSPPQSQAWRSIDLGIRIVLIASLILAVWFVTPLFLEIKFACLALAAALGIAIRIVIAPIAPAIEQLARGEISTAANRTLVRALTTARRLVVCIWTCLLFAAWAGIAKPS